MIRVKKLYFNCKLQPIFFYLIRFLSNSNRFTFRKLNCGDVNSDLIGKQITLFGWVKFKRMNQFIVLRDAYGSIQLYNSKKKHNFDDIPLESVISINGTVNKRPAKDINLKMKNGDIEVAVENIKIINKFLGTHPLVINDFDKPDERSRLRYRYLDLRSNMMQKNLRLRSQFLLEVRNYLIKQLNFVEVETPIMHKRTPGGAQEFVVPTRTPHFFYSLTQSPQQFKQLLMIGGIDRYFQIAKCYRDEGAKPDRQPEFTQIDLEISFTTIDDIISLIENLLQSCWPQNLKSFTIPFQRINYQDAMLNYASDKPDLRSDVKVKDITQMIKPYFNKDKWLGINIENGAKPEVKKELKRIVHQTYKDLYFEDEVIGIEMLDNQLCINEQINCSHCFEDNLKLELNKNFSINEKDFVWLVGSTNNNAVKFMGKFRNKLIDTLIDKGWIKSKHKYCFCWIVNFPLFLKSEHSDTLECSHHPFTAPRKEDEQKIYQDPLSVIGQHFDLVLNGNEVGGGSIRIYNSDLQKYIIESVLKEDSKPLQYFLTALQSGCPPHGGIALGVDRLLAIMCDAFSIRDVIAFPKSSEGKDLMSQAPAPLLDEIKKLYHLN